MVENKVMKSKKKAGFRSLALCMVVCIVMSQLIFVIPSFAYNYYGGSENLAFGKTATASEWVEASEHPKYAVDDDNLGDNKWGTGWTTSAVKWLMVDLGQQYYINRYKISHAGTREFAYYNTRDFRLQYSNDGVNWTTADTVTYNTASITERSTYTFLARYVRLYIDYSDQVNNSCARIYDFQLYYDNLALNKTATASESYSNETPEKAFNGTCSSYMDKWCTGWSTQPKWLAVDLGNVYTIKRFKIVHAGTIERKSEYNTRNFRIQKSSDGINWEDVYIVTGNTSSLTEAEFPNAISSRYVRLKIDQGQQNSDACARIYEFQLYSY